MSIFYTKIRLYAGREQMHNYIEMKTRKKVVVGERNRYEKKIFRRFRT
nr:MAG TPA: hypothetical protein [Caudoviricetes sp.]